MRSVTVVGVTNLEVTFHGVRGSTPCHGPETARYGGNTACVSVRAADGTLVILDLGTGVRYLGNLLTGRPFRGTALVTHLHWDHVQGLPFFQPILEEGNELDVYAPRQGRRRTVKEAFDRIISPPQFPVGLDLYSGTVRFHDLGDNVFSVGGIRVMSRFVPHVGPTLGYRLEFGGSSVAYISDHQQPYDGSLVVPDAVRELADGVDLLIHDSQYTPAEFAEKYYFGHCTQEFAMGVAMSCRARRLALFHHDPVRTDDELDARAACTPSTVEVFPAREGLVVSI